MVRLDMQDRARNALYLRRKIDVTKLGEVGESAVLKCTPGVKLPKNTYTLIHLKYIFSFFLKNLNEIGM